MSKLLSAPNVKILSKKRESELQNSTKLNESNPHKQDLDPQGPKYYIFSSRFYMTTLIELYAYNPSYIQAPVTEVKCYIYPFKSRALMLK